MIKSRYLFSHQTDTAETSTWDFKAKARPQQCLRGGKSLPVIERFTGNWFLYTAFYPLRMTIQRWLFTPADLPSTKDTPNSSSGHHPVTTVQWLWSPGPPPPTSFITLLFATEPHERTRGRLQLPPAPLTWHSAMHWATQPAGICDHSVLGTPEGLPLLDHYASLPTINIYIISSTF